MSCAPLGFVSGEQNNFRISAPASVCRLASSSSIARGVPSSSARYTRLSTRSRRRVPALSRLRSRNTGSPTGDFGGPVQPLPVCLPHRFRSTHSIASGPVRTVPAETFASLRGGPSPCACSHRSRCRSYPESRLPESPRRQLTNQAEALRTRNAYAHEAHGTKEGTHTLRRAVRDGSERLPTRRGWLGLGKPAMTLFRPFKSRPNR